MASSLGAKGSPRVWTGVSAMVLVLGWSWVLGEYSTALASRAKMKAPDAGVHIHGAAMEQTDTSSVRLVGLGAIRFYQKWVSPIGGSNRCGFSPSCSAYGYRAIREQGLAVGILMTADRLMRCNIWKSPGPDYTLLPNGKLYDPPAKNILFMK